MKLYIETYGCQMNVADSELVVSILQRQGYALTPDYQQADLILVNTCAVRESAEQRVLGRLNLFRVLKKDNPALKIGVIGCMAQRMGHELMEYNHAVDLVAGPDSYRSLPEMLEQINQGEKAVHTDLSKTETYHGICPERMDNKGISAYISIMRGCNNFCTYCVVPYTRGRERSRAPESVLNELQRLQEAGYKEVTLLGQNVNSYHGRANGRSLHFPQLLDQVASQAASMRIRFITSHPKDMSEDLLQVMQVHHNISNHIHLPLQSGSNQVLKRMNRKYTREWYLSRIEAIRSLLPGAGITTDVFAGFPGETEEDHQQTLEVMRQVEYDFAFMFRYSDRPGTYAHNRLPDDVPEDTKKRRLQEIIALQQELSETSNRKDKGKTFDVLVEGISRKSDVQVYGRNPQNKVIVFPRENFKTGDFARVKVTNFTKATLLGQAVEKEPVSKDTAGQA